jgi:hypothetical protein
MSEWDESVPRETTIKVPSYIFNDFGMSGTVAKLLPKCQKLHDLFIQFPTSRWEPITSGLLGRRDALWPLSIVSHVWAKNVYFDGFRMTDFPAHDNQSQSCAPASWINHRVKNLSMRIDCPRQIETPPVNMDAFPQAIARFPELQRLVLHMSHFHSGPDLGDYHHLTISGMKLTSLRCLEISCFSTETASLLSLFCSKPGTLSVLQMHNIQLCDIGWAKVWDRLLAIECTIASVGLIQFCRYVEEQADELVIQTDQDAWNRLCSYVSQRRR